MPFEAPKFSLLVFYFLIPLLENWGDKSDRLQRSIRSTCVGCLAAFKPFAVLSAACTCVYLWEIWKKGPFSINLKCENINQKENIWPFHFESQL